MGGETVFESLDRVDVYHIKLDDEHQKELDAILDKQANALQYVMVEVSDKGDREKRAALEEENRRRRTKLMEELALPVLEWAAARPDSLQDAVFLNDLGALAELVCVSEKCELAGAGADLRVPAFHLAVALDRIELVKVLVTKGPSRMKLLNVDCIERATGRTALAVAAKNGSIPIAKFLVQKNAN